VTYDTKTSISNILAQKGVCSCKKI